MYTRAIPFETYEGAYEARKRANDFGVVTTDKHYRKYGNDIHWERACNHAKVKLGQYKAIWYTDDSHYSLANEKVWYKVEESDIKGLYNVHKYEGGEIVESTYRITTHQIGQYMTIEKEMYW